MPETYAYNEDQMLQGIRRFRTERQIAPPPKAVKAAPISIARLVIARVASLFGIGTAYILGPSREWHLMPAREAIAFVLHKRYGYSFARIGRETRRHHTSVVHSFKNSLSRFERDAAFREKVQIMMDEPIHQPCESPPSNDALAILDLDQMCDEIESNLPQALHRLAEAIEDGSIDAKATVLAGGGPSHDPRAHCLVRIKLAAEIRKHILAEAVEIAE